MSVDDEDKKKAEKDKKIASVAEDLNFITDKVSGKVWATSVSVLAFSATVILTYGTKGDSSYIEFYDFFAPMIFCFLAILLDLSQYMAGFLNSRNVLNRLENTSSSLGYSRKDILHKVRNGLFISKVVFCFSGTLWFAIVVSYRIFSIWSGIG